MHICRNVLRVMPFNKFFCLLNAYIAIHYVYHSDFLLQWHRVGSTYNHGQLQQIPQQMSQVLSIIFQGYFGTVKIPKTQYDSINTVFSEIFKFL